MIMIAIMIIINRSPTTAGTTTGGTTTTEGPSLTRGSTSSDLPGESGAASGSASIRAGWNESPD